MSLKLHKRERLCSATAIDALFVPGGAEGALAFPLRMVWRRRPQGRTRTPGVAVQFFISVPKKKLRHAVDRVTMRRRIREAYRLNRGLLAQGLDSIDLAIIYVSSELQPYARVERAMQKLLPQICNPSEEPDAKAAD